MTLGIGKIKSSTNTSAAVAKASSRSGFVIRDTRPRRERQAAAAQMPTKQEREKSKKEMFQAVCRRIKRDYDLAQIIRSHGINLTSAASGYLVANCPFPNHADSSPSFKIKISKPDKYICYGCQAAGDVLDFIRDYHYLKNMGEAVEHLTGESVTDNWNHMQNGRPITESDSHPKSIKTQEKKIEIVIDHEQIKRDLDNATDVYIALIGLLTIEPEHIAQFELRGITLAEAMQLGYRSLPCDRNSRIKICKKLRQAGYDLNKVPGFYRLPKRKYSKGQYCFGGNSWGFRDIKSDTDEVYPCPGVLIPTRDLEGRIRRLKIRNDAPTEDVPADIQDRFPARYMSFSSTNRQEGTSAGAFVHVARPLYLSQTNTSAGNDSVLWITEGEIKADISALYLQQTVLGMPGVGQCPDKAITEALAGKFTEICVAMDAEEKPHVKLAIAKLIRLAKQNGLKTSVAVWEAEQGKGLDDLVAGGGAPIVIPADNWWNRLTAGQQHYIRQRIFDNRGTTQKSESAVITNNLEITAGIKEEKASN